MVAAYEQALSSTEARSRSDWAADPQALHEAIKGLQRYYGNVTRSSVAALTREIYAHDAYLCDTLHIARGAREIEAYFLETAERVTAMEVAILDFSASGREVYTRWRMTITAEELADGRATTTYGISHLRFDRQGKIVLHQDFWDASTGFFEHLPVLKHILPGIRGIFS